MKGINNITTSTHSMPFWCRISISSFVDIDIKISSMQQHDFSIYMSWLVCFLICSGLKKRFQSFSTPSLCFVLSSTSTIDCGCQHCCRNIINSLSSIKRLEALIQFSSPKRRFPLELLKILIRNNISSPYDNVEVFSN